MGLKFIEEYRDGTIAKALVKKIHALATTPINLMEVCGTHTTAIFRHGIRSVLPDTITLLSGPGCPVCVTAQKDINAFTAFASIKNVIVTTFGDLMRVPGSNSTLAKEKARGADVRIVYSMFDAVNIAQDNPDKEVVFCAVGFETTIPTIAAGLLMADLQGIKNFTVHTANKLTPPALSALMQTKGVTINGFILPGHVSVITGTQAYSGVFETYHVPSVIAGFEPLDILNAVYRLTAQNRDGLPALENGYKRAVSKKGNVKANQITAQVFETCNAVWRGIGEIPESGMQLKPEFSRFRADKKFNIDMIDVPEPKGCACGDILMGLKTPLDCSLYKKKCTPMDPVGPCMVSTEGACAAYYRYHATDGT